jgi:hypothetical protein
MTRIMLLNVLSERGVLNYYLADDSLKRKLPVALAPVPFNKNDLSEARSQKFHSATVQGVNDKRSNSKFARRERQPEDRSPQQPSVIGRNAGLSQIRARTSTRLGNISVFHPQGASAMGDLSAHFPSTARPGFRLLRC